MRDSFYIRTRRGVEGPVSRERVDQLVARNQVGSLDEISPDGHTWTRIRLTEFWGSARRAPPPSTVLTSAPVAAPSLGPESRLASEAMPPPTGERSLTPSETVSRIALPAEPEKRCWKLPTMEEEERKKNADAGKVKRMKSPNATFSIWQVLFSGVFKRHDETSVSAILNGKARLVREGEQPETWLWSRILLVSVVLSSILWYVAIATKNPIALPGFFFMAAFGVPLAVLVFFLECNTGGCVSGWKAMGLFLVGGVLSILFTQLFNNTELAESLYGSMNDAGAGPIEEPAKAVVLLWFAGQSKRHPFILDGLLLGAAVGAGFAAFETAGYIFLSLEEGGVNEMTTVAVWRGIMAPFAHIAWTAAIGAAMWMSRGLHGSLGDALCSWRTVGALLLSIILHALWNAGMAGTWLSQIAWVPILYYLKRGIAQCVESRTAKGGNEA